MRKIILFLMLFLTSTPLFASKYVVERDDGNLTIIDYADGSSDTIQDVLRKLGLRGQPFHQVDSIPDEKIEYLMWDGNGVAVDQAKKDAARDERQEQVASKEALLERLNLTRDQARLLFRDDL